MTGKEAFEVKGEAAAKKGVTVGKERAAGKGAAMGKSRSISRRSVLRVSLIATAWKGETATYSKLFGTAEEAAPATHRLGCFSTVP